MADPPGSGCITSVLRLHSIYIVANSDDITWDNVGAATWSSIELNTAIICACLPTLKPVVNIVFPRLLGTRDRTVCGPLQYYPNSRIVVGRYQEFNVVIVDERRKQSPTYTAEITSGGHG